MSDVMSQTLVETILSAIEELEQEGYKEIPRQAREAVASLQAEIATLRQERDQAMNPEPWTEEQIAGLRRAAEVRQRLRAAEAENARLRSALMKARRAAILAIVKASAQPAETDHE